MRYCTQNHANDFFFPFFEKGKVLKWSPSLLTNFVPYKKRREFCIIIKTKRLFNARLASSGMFFRSILVEFKLEHDILWNWDIPIVVQTQFLSAICYFKFLARIWHKRTYFYVLISLQ